MAKVAVLCVGVGGWHPKGVQRLKNTLLFDEVFKFDTITWTDAYPPDSPTHYQTPYAFKAFAFEYAKKLGYDIVLWLDSSIYAKHSIQPIIDQIKHDGHFMLKNGWKAGEWLCDNQIEALGLTREESMQFDQLVGGCIGLDFRNKTSMQFFNEYFESTKRWKGEWKNTGECSCDNRVLGSRHDQAFASVISQRLGMKWHDCAGWLSYNRNDDTILIAEGM